MTYFGLFLKKIWPNFDIQIIIHPGRLGKRECQHGHDPVRCIVQAGNHDTRTAKDHHQRQIDDRKVNRQRHDGAAQSACGVKRHQPHHVARLARARKRPKHEKGLGRIMNRLVDVGRDWHTAILPIALLCFVFGALFGVAILFFVTPALPAPVN